MTPATTKRKEGGGFDLIPAPVNTILQQMVRQKQHLMDLTHCLLQAHPSTTPHLQGCGVPRGASNRALHGGVHQWVPPPLSVDLQHRKNNITTIRILINKKVLLLFSGFDDLTDPTSPQYVIGTHPPACLLMFWASVFSFW
ncbi:hypothetical protein E2C01_022813 [Portunus trituberculatus]|uniref:Uncharacterized protein n=1 Tax=Portunus trituberculatus TaxID=210409 RepID=A0A5B7E9C3_PORTR|nr:hypothetical protein [Portunus trituberculatus]